MLSCPLRLGLPFFLFFLASLVGFETLPFRGVGVGFEELHLQLMFWLVESGFPWNSHMPAYTAHQSGLVLWYCLE